MSDPSEPLTPEQRRYAHAMFKVRILQSNGQRFEDFFVSIMTRRDPRFRPVKPQGTAKPFLAKDLEREFWELSTADKEAVLEQVIPRPQYIQDIDYAALAAILQHLVDSQVPIQGDGLTTVPDYDRKIQFNNINLSPWFRCGSRESETRIARRT